MKVREEKLHFIVSICILAFHVFVNTPQVEGANILFFFGVSSYSHRIPAWPLAEALAEKGHNVTFVSPFRSKTPNSKIQDFVPRKLVEFVETWDELDDVFRGRKENNLLKGWYTLPDFGIMACEFIYEDDEYIKWMKGTKIDLVIIDSFFNECAYGMVHYWNAKSIVFTTSTAFSWYPDSFGLPDESTWIPMMELFYPLEMTLPQRIKNALIPIAWHLYRKWKYLPELEIITKNKLGIPNLPKFEDIERNTSMVFMNTHYAEEFARSLPPNFISIGGIAWVNQSKQLPEDLETFLEKGDGFIYMSLGTHADFTKMGRDIQASIIVAMNNFSSIQFVWKVSNDSLLQEFPSKNVYINNWMPQQQILAHPKIKAFITHAGLLGIQEAIMCGVPLISFPIFAEQDYNAERIHRKEYGIRLEITTVTQSELQDAITKILTDPTYRKNTQRISTLFRDRPFKPLDLAVFWTDFVLRHDGEELASLRPANINQSWWKRRQIDIWVLIISLFSAFFTAVIYCGYKILGLVIYGKSLDNCSNHKEKRQ